MRLQATAIGARLSTSMHGNRCLSNMTAQTLVHFIKTQKDDYRIHQIFLKVLRNSSLVWSDSGFDHTVSKTCRKAYKIGR